MPQNIGLIGTGVQATNDTVVREVGAAIGLLEPNEAPLITLLSKIPNGPPTTQPKFEFKEDDYLARWAVNSNNAYAAGVTTIVVVDATLFAVDDIFLVPPAANSSAPPERCRVTAINYGTNTLTVQRAIGGVGAMTIPANSPLRIIGPASGEGSAVRNSKRTVPVNLSNYTQIFKHTLDWTNTSLATKQYGMPSGQKLYDHDKLLKEHKIGLNGSLLWGVPSENLTGSADGLPIRTTGGLHSRISTNVVDAGGALTYTNFLTYVDQAFRYGAREKLFLVPTIVSNFIHEVAFKRLQIQQATTEFGLQITRVKVPSGVLNMVLDRSLENISGVGFGNQCFIIDMPNIRKRVLAGNGINRDTQILENVVMDGRDRVVDVALTECGWEITQEKTHARWYNITSYTVPA